MQEEGEERRGGEENLGHYEVNEEGVLLPECRVLMVQFRLKNHSDMDC